MATSTPHIYDRYFDWTEDEGEAFASLDSVERFVRSIGGGDNDVAVIVYNIESETGETVR